MVWGMKSLGEFCGSFVSSFMERRKITQQRGFGTSEADIHVGAAENIERLRENCLPIEDHVTRRGLKQVYSALNRKDHFAAQLGIDANPGPSKTDICITLLKATVSYLCSDNAADRIRAATYTMIACQ